MLVAKQLTKYYGSVCALNALDLEISQGHVVGVLGLNGAGKTTTFKLLSGTLLPSSGSVTIHGVSVSHDLKKALQFIGFLPETPPLYIEMAVRDYLKYLGQLRNVPQLNLKIDHVLDSTDLQEVQYERIETLSHGYRKRIGIAQAILHHPSLILLDEPTSGLDPYQVLHMRELIQRMKQHHTVLISSHVLSEVHQVCDRICVLDQGKLIAEGTEEEFSKKINTSTRLSIEIRGNVEFIQNIFSNHESIQSYEIEFSKDSIHRISLLLKNDVREEIVDVCIHHGFKLRSLEVQSFNLESIFLSLTENKRQ